MGAARAEEPVMLSLTIKDHQFVPAEVQAPAGKSITFTIKNLGTIASEFESGVLHVEKVIPPGGEATFMYGRWNRGVIISSTISIARRRDFWWCNEPPNCSRRCAVRCLCFLRS